MSLRNSAVTLDISIATTSTTTSIPPKKEEGPTTIAPQKSPSSSSPPPSPPLLPLLPLLPQQKQQPTLESETSICTLEHPNQQQKQGEEEEEAGEDEDEDEGEGEEEKDDEAEDNERKDQQGEQEGKRKERHTSPSTKSPNGTVPPLKACESYDFSSIGFNFDDAPLVADDCDGEGSEYDLSGIGLEGKVIADITKIRRRDQPPAPGAKRILKRVRVRKDTSSSKKRTKKHNLRAAMATAAVTEKLAAERSERNRGKEIKREKKKERLQAVVEWKPVEPVSKPRVRPSGLRHMESCYSDPENEDEEQGSEQTGQKRKREDESLGDDEDDLEGYSSKPEASGKRQHQNPCESETETGALQSLPCVSNT